MSFLCFWYYLIINILGIHYMPRIVVYNNIEWFSVFGKENGVYFLCYSRYVGRNYKEAWCGVETEDLVGVVDESKYFVYLKMLKQLWLHRKEINFCIDSY